MTARRAVAAKSEEMEKKLAKAEKGALPPCVFKPVNEAVYLETGRVMSMYLGMATVVDGKYKIDTGEEPADVAKKTSQIV